MDYKISDIYISHEKSPLGMDIKTPVFSWKFNSCGDGFKQAKVKITVGQALDGSDMWDSGLFESGCSSGIAYGGKNLSPRTKYYVKIETVSTEGNKTSAQTEFETGLMNPRISAWNGAKWIGAPEYYVCGEALGVFSIESEITVVEGKTAGIVFGANDERLKNRERNEYLIEGENYICYCLNTGSSPAALDIYRVGYHKDDKNDIPFAHVPLLDGDRPIINEENMHKPHMLKVNITGNCAETYLDGFFIERRQLNPIGGNDVPTYPRLCETGYFVQKGTKAFFNGIVLSYLRSPSKRFLEIDAEAGVTIDAIQCNEDKFVLHNINRHSLPMLRRDFSVRGSLKKARLYATARGIYDCMINGSPVSENYFPPGSSQYDKHLMYQTYDITKMLISGENGIGFTLSSGWWNGPQTFSLTNFNYWGDKESLLVMIVLTYDDGSEDVIVSDEESWRYYGEGPYRYASFFIGEHFDANLKHVYDNFSKPGFNINKNGVSAFQKPVAVTADYIGENDSYPGFFRPWPAVNKTEPEIVGHYNAPITAVEEFKAVKMTSPAVGVYIYDLGQEIAGVPSLKLKGAKGVKVLIRHAEMLYPDLAEYGELSGRLLQSNLRDASSEDIYILRGDAQGEEYIPKFTFHGFRYIEISGLGYAPLLDEVWGIQLSSLTAITGSIKTDNPLINKLVSNVKYSQLANSISIPTDCPQRNERLGWAGDAHVFARTGMYQADIRTFYLRYIQAYRDGQTPDGRLPEIAPVGGGFGGITFGSCLHLVVWEMYRQYKEINVIEENYDAMIKYMDYIEGMGMPGLSFVGPIDDWLSLASTDSHLVWNAFYTRDAYLTSVYAKILGKEDDYRVYSQKFASAKAYWNKTFVDPQTGKTLRSNGTVNDTQGGYSIGLNFDMFDDSTKEKAYRNLSDRVKADGYRISTGFFGTGHVCSMLSEGGYADDAYNMITQTEYPSWLYPVTQGATTVWERWNGYTHEKGFGGNNKMNSFNHYSLGSVVSWLYEYALGIKPGDKDGHYIIKPDFTGFRQISGGYETQYGRIESGYTINRDNTVFKCVIPPNAYADIILPGVSKCVGSGKYSYDLKMEI